MMLVTHLGGGSGRDMGSAAKFLLATKELRGRLVFEIVRAIFPNKLKSSRQRSSPISRPDPEPALNVATKQLPPTKTTKKRPTKIVSLN